MKKVGIVCLCFSVFSFIFCVIYGLISIAVPEYVLSVSVGYYKFLSILQIFFGFLPSILATSYVVGLSIYFGSDQEGSLTRFSPAMFVRYRKILFSSVVFVAIISFSNLLFIPLINNKLESYREIPGLIKEYQKLSEKLFNEKKYEQAFIFAKKAFDIDSKNQKTYKLMTAAELEMNNSNNSSSAESEIFKKDINQQKRKRIFATVPHDVYELLKTARECFKNEDYFGAHYNSTMALNISSERDLNVSELKQIAAESWNKLTFPGEPKPTEEQKIFAKKLEGYASLINGDYLKSYYIFKNLSEQSKKLSLDIDVATYLEKAEEFVKNSYFFIDETYNLVEFEKFNNVNFKIQNKDGSKTLVFIKGITPVVETTENVLFFRNLTIMNVDSEGNVVSGCFDSYAKAFSISTDIFEEETKETLGISGFKYVPLVKLVSVDRKLEGVFNSPEKIENVEFSDFNNFMILPVSFENFELIQKASKGPENMNLLSLFKFVGISDEFGFSSDVFAQSLFNKMVFPFLILSLMILISVFAWNCRLNENQVFKFKWIIIFPFAGSIFYLLYRIILIFFKFFNFAMLSIGGYRLGLVLSVSVQVLFIILFSVVFLSQTNK